MSLRSSGCGAVYVSSFAVLRLAGGTVLVHACREAGEEDDEGCEEEEDHGGEDGPHSRGEDGVRSAAVLVDLVLDDAPGDEVTGHDCERDDKGDGRDERGQQRSKDTSAERKEERNECKSSCDRVKDHDAGKGLRGIDGCVVVADLVDLLHDGGWVVADALLGAVVLVGPVCAVSQKVSWNSTWETNSAGATSSTQWPNVPKVTDEWRISDLLVSVTFNMAMSLMTGAEMVVMRRRMAAANSKNVPTWWKIPVLAILTTCSW